jgi:hypothetical protein
MVKKFSPCLSVLAVFQQTEIQCFAYNSYYNSPMRLKFSEHSDHKIYENLGIQHTAHKCKEHGL